MKTYRSKALKRNVTIPEPKTDGARYEDGGWAYYISGEAVAYGRTREEVEAKVRNARYDYAVRH